MKTDTVTISRNQISIIVAGIAILTFAWNIASDYNARGAKIDRLEYQISLAESRGKELLEKYDDVVKALNKQAIAFEQMKAEFKRQPSR